MKNLRDLFKRLPPDGHVRHLLRSFNLAPIADGKAKSVRVLAESLGFDVVRSRLPTGVAGRLVQDAFSSNGYRIEVNETLSVQAQRWAVLHEIGHFFLHVDRDDFLANPSYLDRSANAFYVETNHEKEANEFAAVLLFGDGALAAAQSLHGRDLKLLAKLFGVSEKAIEIALKQFR
ncbi:ImmA/IrrE family metallo-endopeptidase [Albidovulum sp.]|jgi:hypothetical protein|uniref:ImmA/IrrE family metallo-endopeptidase n=1 Tax=Albidovulum sp. TaxID=1872424 RepID=UPI00305FAB1D